MIDCRICGNSAYVLGSTVESEQGLKKFLSVFVNTKIVDIVQIFGQMLTHKDGDCVLNATGTLGTIVCRFATVNLFKQLHRYFLRNTFNSFLCLYFSVDQEKVVILF